MIAAALPFLKMAMPYVLGAGAGLLGGKGAKDKNKSLEKALQQVAFEKYSGLKPPEFKNLRPVEDQVTDLLMKRSRGEDVGFDPRRRALLQETYDLEQQPRLAEQRADIVNQLSGAGLSRNLGAREALLGRALQEAERNRNIYRNKIDIEDLATRQQERERATGALQQWGQFGFGQENQRAGFDSDIWAKEQGLSQSSQKANMAARMHMEEQKESPLGSALAAGLSALGMFKGGGGGLQSILGSVMGGKKGGNTSRNLGMINTSLGSGVRNYGMIPGGRTY